MTKTFTGVHWMLATPFLDNEEVDVNSISNLMQKAYSSRCEGVVVLGVTGESARLQMKKDKLSQEKLLIMLMVCLLLLAQLQQVLKQQ